jgi:hypothetical protein
LQQARITFYQGSTALESLKLSDIILDKIIVDSKRWDILEWANT